MSSASNTTPAPSVPNPHFNSALAEYSKHTGKNLLNHPQAAAIDQWESPDSILSVFQEQSGEFDKFRNGDPKLADRLEYIVFELHAIGLSAALHAGATLVSPTQFHILSPTHFNSYF